jgi:hypothetical protein
MRVFLPALALFLVAAPLLANPNSGDPESAFDATLKDAAGSLVAEGQNLYQQIIDANRKNVEAAEAGRGERIKPDDLGQTMIALQRLNRLSRRLASAGETAGHDFQHRHREEHAITSRLIDGTRGFPAAIAYLDKARQVIARSTESRMRELKQIEEMAQKGQWEQAETRIYRTLDQLDGLTIYINDNNEISAIYTPYARAQGAIDAEMAKTRKQFVMESLTAQRDAQAPMLDSLLQQIDAATKAVSQSGAAEIDGQSLDGPSLLTRFGERWKELQAAAIRCRAANWALSAAGEGGGYYDGTALPSTSGPKADPLEAKYAQFSRSIGPALVQLVQADAARAGGAEVESLHQAFLEALAPLALHAADPGFAANAQKSLDQLAAKSPQLNEMATAYREATDEILRWRRRAAEAAAGSRAAQYPEAPRQLLQATQGKLPFGGLFNEQKPDFPRAQLLSSAPAIVAWSKDKLLSQPVWITATTAVAPNKTGVSRYEDRTYCTVTLPPAPPAEQIAALEQDLLVGESAPPLSLAARAALDSARRGDFTAAGGTIRAYHLESVLARWANMPQSAWVLTRLGELPPESNTYSLAPHVLARFDVTPHWIRHEYFFTELPGGE